MCMGGVLVGLGKPAAFQDTDSITFFQILSHCALFSEGDFGPEDDFEPMKKCSLSFCT